LNIIAETGIISVGLGYLVKYLGEFFLVGIFFCITYALFLILIEIMIIKIGMCGGCCLDS